MLIGSASVSIVLVLAVYLLALPTLHMALTATVAPFQKTPPMPNSVIIATAAFALLAVVSFATGGSSAPPTKAEPVLPTPTAEPAVKPSLLSRVRGGCWAPGDKKQPELV